MTARQFLLPDLGEGLASAEVVAWLVAAGDTVEVDQPVVEVMTAKTNVELPSPFAGVVTALHHTAGDVVEVGQPLVTVEAEVGAAEVAAAEAERSPSDGSSGNVLVGYGTRPARSRRRARVTAAGAAMQPPTTPPVTSPATTPASHSAPQPGVPAVVSPVVRRLARERGVDLHSLRGSGPQGLISRADVEAASTTPAPGAVAGPGGAGGRLPIRGLQRQMAELVTRSRREIPEATVWVDVDASGLLSAREASRHWRDDAQPLGVAALVARFCLLGLQRWPVLHGRIDGDEVVVPDLIGLGFAAQSERGLVVPVVQDAGRLTLSELDAEMRRLSTAARSGTLVPSELAGGTFTLNNYGVFGVDGSAAIINHPQVAMIGVGRIIERAWVVAGELAVRPVTELTLAFDHRVCDGGVAGGFLRYVADCVEQPLIAL